ncbi:hypothetical protein [Trueperella pecoris]|uniref:hypothetical protein n=1 Tax=Trueperella pecoris TaxID=2733571 RepID=UPI001ABDBE75|nr:hypothetical protein [Trueperella pecoris]QTG75902.1 hypothetical protein J4179_02235 [Trueperella pecoris]
MDWLLLAYDIASKVEQEEREGLLAEVADLADAERATLTVEDRIRGSMGALVHVGVRGPKQSVRGRVKVVGQGWFLLEDGADQHVVLIPAVTSVYQSSIVHTCGPDLPVTVGSFLRELQYAYAQFSCVDMEVSAQIIGVGRDHVLVDKDGDSARYGSWASPWHASYDYEESERLLRLVLPISAIAVISQARVNRAFASSF